MASIGSLRALQYCKTNPNTYFTQEGLLQLQGL